MATVSRLHGQVLRITQASSRIFARQLLQEFTRVGNAWTRAARKFSEHPQDLESVTQSLLPSHGFKVKEIIRKNNVRVMRAIHDFQMELLGVKSNEPLYAKTRSAISALSDSLASTASGEMLSTTQKVLETGVDMVSVEAEPDNGIAFVRERMTGGVAQRRSRNVADDQAHRAAQEMLNTIGNTEVAIPLWKTWMSRRDSKVRPTHRHANGQTVKTNETFTIGDAQLKFPGDPTGPAKETINCRCSIRITKRNPKKRAA